MQNYFLGVIEQAAKKKHSKFSPKEYYHINMFRPDLRILNKVKVWEGETGKPLEMSSELLRRLVRMVESKKPKQINSIRSTKEFAEIEILTSALQKVSLSNLDGQERMLFFINVRNLLFLHTQISKKTPTNLLERKEQLQNSYIIEEHPYSIEYLEDVILRGTTEPSSTDPRRNNVSVFPTNILVFALCDCTVSSPKPFWFDSTDTYKDTLSQNISNFLQGEHGINESELQSNNILQLPKLLKGVFENSEIVSKIKPYLSEKTRNLINQIEKAVVLDVTYRNSSFQSHFEYK